MRNGNNVERKRNSESSRVDEQNITSSNRVYKDSKIGGYGIGKRGQQDSGNIFKNRGILANESKGDNRTDRKNNQGLEKSSSFNLQKNKGK